LSFISFDEGYSHGSAESFELVFVESLSQNCSGPSRELLLTEGLDPLTDVPDQEVWSQTRYVLCVALSVSVVLLSATSIFDCPHLSSSLQTVCGTCAVDVPGVENIDVTDLVSGHQDYTLVTGEILKRARHGEPFLSEGTDTGIADEEKRQIAQLRESLESENHR